jgi:hypothetical protein
MLYTRAYSYIGVKNKMVLHSLHSGKTQLIYLIYTHTLTHTHIDTRMHTDTFIIDIKLT